MFVRGIDTDMGELFNRDSELLAAESGDSRASEYYE
jgi:hypothetical protein